LCTLHGNRPSSQEICNEYAAQTIFCQSQAYPTENNPEKNRIFWLFISKKVKGVKKQPEFHNLASKSQIGNPATQEWRMRIMYAKKLSIFCYV